MGAEAEVDRLRSSIASLHEKIGDVVMTSSKAHTVASKARQRASSKLREADRHEKKALDADKRRADLERQLATKMKALSSAEARLNRERSTQLEVAGEAATQLTDSAKAQYPGADWKGAVRSRIVYAHQYHRIDRDLLWNTATTSPPALLRELGPPG